MKNRCCVLQHRPTVCLAVPLALCLGLALALLGLIAVGAPGAHADPGVLYVVPGGLTSGGCGNWAQACDLQRALDQAVEGDEIWVAQGLYTPTLRTDPLVTRTATFQLKNGVALYGGFEGNETQRDQRDWQTHLTVLSGDLDGDDTVDPDGIVTDPNKIVDPNAFHVLTGSGVTGTAVLDGFVVTAGKANGGGHPNNGGGGMLNVNGSPTLRNLTFRGNQGTYGGGIYDFDQSSPKLAYVTFTGNRAGYGAGINGYGDQQPTLSQVTFRENWAGTLGGGLYNANSDPTLTDVTFEGNTAPNGGGMYNFVNADPLLVGVTFVGNSATTGAGGGMYNQESHPRLVDVTFLRNTASGSGAGMANREASNPILVGVRFLGNRTTNGGGAGMHNKNDSQPLLMNVLFSGNSAQQNGGAIHNFGGSDAVLVNVTISGNELRTSFGGAIYNQGSSPVISNTILWGNTALVSPTIYNTGASTPTLYHSDVEGALAGGSWDTGLGEDAGGNLDADPHFLRAPSPGGDGTWGTADDDYGDLRTQTGSPVVDAGDNDSVPADTLDVDGDGNTSERVPTDLAGGPRIVGGTVDMGAYEATVEVGIVKRVSTLASSPSDSVLVAQGQALTYTLFFSNSGTYTATGIVITDLIPASVLSTSVESDGPAANAQPGSRYIWQVGALPPGKSGVLTVTGMLAGCPPPDHIVANTATLEAETDLDPDNNRGWAVATVLNDPPLAVADAYTTPYGTSLVVAAPGLLDNDSDPNCDPIQAGLDSPPGTGSVALLPDGSFVYTPASGFAGVDTFSYEASDGTLGDTALVRITIEAQPVRSIYLPLVMRVGP